MGRGLAEILKEVYRIVLFSIVLFHREGKLWICEDIRKRTWMLWEAGMLCGNGQQLAAAKKRLGRHMRDRNAGQQKKTALSTGRRIWWGAYADAETRGIWFILPPETGHPTNLINFYLSGFNTYIQGIIGGSIQNGCPAGSIITRQRSSYWYSDKLAPHDKAYFTPSSTSWTWKSKCAICCCASRVAGHTGGT